MYFHHDKVISDLKSIISRLEIFPETEPKTCIFNIRSHIQGLMCSFRIERPSWFDTAVMILRRSQT